MSGGGAISRAGTGAALIWASLATLAAPTAVADAAREAGANEIVLASVEAPSVGAALQDGGRLEKNAPPSQCSAVETGGFQGVGALGVVEPAGGVHRIGAASEGVVSRVAVRPGDRVATGAILFALDDRTERAELSVAESALALARARAAAQGAELRRKQAEARAAEAALAASRAAAADAEHLAQAAARLQGGAALSGRERMHRKHALAQADAAVSEAGARLAQAVAERDALDPARNGERAAVAAAEVAEAEARRDLALARLQARTIRAPMAGRVLSVSVRPGERIERGAEPPVLLGASGPLRLRVEIDALDLPRLDLQSGKPSFAITALRRGGGDNGPGLSLSLQDVEPMVANKSLFADALSEPLDRRVAVAYFAIAHRPEGSQAALRVGELLEVRFRPQCAAALKASVVAEMEAEFAVEPEAQR